MYIFSMENPFFRFVGKVVDLVWLNILTLVCSLPIFTMGAAITAMYRVLLNSAMNEETPVTVEFFKAFKNNFKKATLVFIPEMLILTIFLSNAYLIYQGVLAPLGNLYIPVGIAIGFLALFVIAVATYYFAIISRYDTDIKTALKNAVLLDFAYFPKTLCMLVILASPVAVCMVSDYFVWFWFLYGISFPAYVISLLIGGIFMKLENKNEKKNVESEVPENGQGTMESNDEES